MYDSVKALEGRIKSVIPKIIYRNLGTNRDYVLHISHMTHLWELYKIFFKCLNTRSQRRSKKVQRIDAMQTKFLAKIKLN